MYQKMKLVEKSNAEPCAKAFKAGIRVAIGIDFGLSDSNTTFKHGTNGYEFVYAVEAGLTPLQAIEAGTASAPATLGPQAPLSGQLRSGYDADFIALSKNPVEDIEVLADRRNITHVWKGRKLRKSPDEPLPW